MSEHGFGTGLRIKYVGTGKVGEKSVTPCRPPKFTKTETTTAIRCVCLTVFFFFKTFGLLAGYVTLFL